MKKKISKPLLIGGIALLVVIVLVIGVVLMLFGGGKKEVSTDPLNLYNKVLVGMPKEEAEAFARDIEEGRRLYNKLEVPRDPWEKWT